MSFITHEPNQQEMPILALVKDWSDYEVRKLIWSLAQAKDMLIVSPWLKSQWQSTNSNQRLNYLQESLDRLIHQKDMGDELLCQAHNVLDEVEAENTCSDCGLEDFDGKAERLFSWTGFTWICETCNKPYKEARLKREAEEAKAAAPATADGKDEFPSIAVKAKKARK